MEKEINVTDFSHAFVDGSTLYRFYYFGITPWTYYRENPWILKDKLEKVMEKLE